MIERHKKEMEEVLKQVKMAKGNRKKQLLKHYHRMKKDLIIAERYLKESR